MEHTADAKWTPNSPLATDSRQSNQGSQPAGRQRGTGIDCHCLDNGFPLLTRWLAGPPPRKQSEADEDPEKKMKRKGISTKWCAPDIVFLSNGSPMARSNGWAIFSNVGHG